MPKNPRAAENLVHDNRRGTKRYGVEYPADAAFIDRARFYALVEQCVLTAVTARSTAKDRARVAGLAPDFGVMAYEIRAALARACRKEIAIKEWPDLTPAEGTPGLNDPLPFVRS